MSYSFLVARTFPLVFSLVVVGCGAAAAPDSLSTTDSQLDDGTDATVTFAADFTTRTSGSLVAGHKAIMSYDASRLTACRGDINGGPGWAITGYYRLNGGAVQTFEAGGLSPSHSTGPASIALTAPGDLEVWFQNTSMWGCSAYDSSFGKNYHFNVVVSDNAPGWVGNARYVLSRGTCNNGPCDADFQPLDGGFTYDTWTRERAAIRRAYFEVWKQGTTDRDNPKLWKELDVEVHTRIGDAGTFDTRYVSFDSRTGNNARYALDLTSLDPLAAPSTLTNKADCPAFPVTYEGTGATGYIDADVQFYFTVNGVELRPQAGGVFHGKYQNYGGLYAICQ